MCKKYTVGGIPRDPLTARSVQVCFQGQFQTCIAMETVLTFHPRSCYTCQQVTTAPWIPRPPHLTVTLEQGPEIR